VRGQNAPAGSVRYCDLVMRLCSSRQPSLKADAIRSLFKERAAIPPACAVRGLDVLSYRVKLPSWYHPPASPHTSSFLSLVT